MMKALQLCFYFTLAFTFICSCLVLKAQNTNDEIINREQEYKDFVRKKQEEASQFMDYEKYKCEQFIQQATKEFNQFMQQERLEFLQYEKLREGQILAAINETPNTGSLSVMVKELEKIIPR
ncbi:MAG: hypothetical protein V1783_03070, partial [Bacteroidota bacterium]